MTRKETARRRRISSALKAKWASGTRKPQPREAYARMAATQKVMRANQGGAFKIRAKEKHLAGCRKGAAGNLAARTPERLAALVARNKAATGIPAIGGNIATDANVKALRWVIRSPRNNTYAFTNLRHWARTHAYLFEDDRPGAKQRFPIRIAHGISSLFSPDGRHGSYKGWTGISQTKQP